MDVQARLSGVCKLFAKAIKGDLRAARLLVCVATEYFTPEDWDRYETEIVGETEAARLLQCDRDGGPVIPAGGAGSVVAGHGPRRRRRAHTRHR